MPNKYSVGDTVLNDWVLNSQIGEGSFGKVFLAERKDFGRLYRSAIKIITIPQNESEVKSAKAEGMDQESVSAYFKGFVEQLVDEFDLMTRLKGNTNIVSYEDHRVIPHQDHIGWDIIIRMELLTPLIDYVTANSMTRQDVIRLGIDLCKALELCQKYNIIHRDIKPENIFVSDNGDFKLGDFGIARTIEKTASGMSKKGTYAYMAPEVYKEEPYGTGVDIYSLGIVLYWLLNESRTPFLPPRPEVIKPADRDNALRLRIKGEQIPAPKNADGRLAEIVLKACAYDPKDRYSSPLQMRQELEAILYDRGEAPYIYPSGDEVPVGTIPGPQNELTELVEKTELLDAADRNTYDDEKTELDGALGLDSVAAEETADMTVLLEEQAEGQKFSCVWLDGLSGTEVGLSDEWVLDYIHFNTPLLRCTELEVSYSISDIVACNPLGKQRVYIMPPVKPNEGSIPVKWELVGYFAAISTSEPELSIHFDKPVDIERLVIVPDGVYGETPEDASFESEYSILDGHFQVDATQIEESG